MIVIPEGGGLQLEQALAQRTGLRGISDIVADLMVTYDLGAIEQSTSASSKRAAISGDGADHAAAK